MAEAILNGIIVDDGGLTCEGRFQYGLTPALGTFTAWKGAYTIGDAFQQLVTGLPGARLIYFRAEARNAAGTGIAGGILSFTTTTAIIPVVATQPATLISDSFATLNGYLANHGDRPGQVSFEYGATTTYGMSTPWQEGFQTGDSFFSLISGLSEGQAYHFRARFRNGRSVAYGSDMVFSSLSIVGGLTLIDDSIMMILEEA